MRRCLILMDPSSVCEEFHLMRCDAGLMQLKDRSSGLISIFFCRSSRPRQRHWSSLPFFSNVVLQSAINTLQTDAMRLPEKLPLSVRKLAIEMRHRPTGGFWRPPRLNLVQTCSPSFGASPPFLGRIQVLSKTASAGSHRSIETFT